MPAVPADGALRQPPGCPGAGGSPVHGAAGSGRQGAEPAACDSPQGGVASRSPRHSRRPARADPAGEGCPLTEERREARDINDRFFSIQEGALSKRLTVFEQTDTPAPSSDGQARSASPADGELTRIIGTPKPDLGALLSDDHLLEPTPLNCTLGHSMSELEFFEARKRGIDQAQRLARLQRGRAPTMRQRDSEPLALALVGLPACGKTYVARRILRYLTWMGIRCKVFNVGIYRRRMLGHQEAAFFDPRNGENQQRRDEVVEAALADVVDYLRRDGGQVAIYDATNTTVQRRSVVRETLLGGPDPVLHEGRLVFVEITAPPHEHEALMQEAGHTMPEYQDAARWTHAEAVADLRLRVEHYRGTYERLSREEGSFIAADPWTERMRMHRIQGYLPGRLAFLLMNLRIKRRNVFVCHTAELDCRVVQDAREAASAADLGTQGGSAALTQSLQVRQQLAAQPSRPDAKGSPRAFLSPEGERFARGLTGLLRDRVQPGEDVVVWTSNDAAGAATAFYVASAGYNVISWRYLGPFGFSVSQKLMGETFEDVTERLEPIIFELERAQAHTLIIASPRVAQLLSGYLGERPAPVAVQPHTVVRVLPCAFGFESEIYRMQSAADSHVPSSCPGAFDAAPLWSGSPASISPAVLAWPPSSAAATPPHSFPGGALHCSAADGLVQGEEEPPIEIET
eukprot:TRINITY_DN148_c0_g1_i1.p1 TRINITY_DN148_c0_g1~~TRINITY_DN148_c0_g1_i1.p1  ORF type:complete len:687 (+),score=253.19 TRINITY_DN148_c0_g1_i1:94-2154(+)